MDCPENYDRRTWELTHLEQNGPKVILTKSECEQAIRAIMPSSLDGTKSGLKYDEWKAEQRNIIALLQEKLRNLNE